ncbi:glycoside hydrolase family 88 protein [Fodinibius sp. Rm-B-1B1-1]|uniref:glycoside hydrolase family 88 protein n=1 Tax=Fodinibius alkaliphilus TaxID=3140241 RepID=UPI003159F676
MKNFIVFVSILLIWVGCQKSGESEKELEELIEHSLETAVTQYKALHEAVPEDRSPQTIVSTTNDSLVTSESDWWVSGFFPGSLWYLSEFSESDSLKKIAKERTWAIEQEKNNASDHDIGFKIYCSFGNAFRITGDSAYADVMMTAAETLTKRYDEDVQAIRSWGDKDDQEGPYQVIIDNMMNLELLFWATGYSGDSTYADIAINHADKTLEHHFRDDGSSYHVVDYDPQTGEVLEKRTAQGYADSSAWARGQAWGLYGYTMAYRETGFDRYLKKAKEIADFLLDHPRLPDDNIPYWDFDAPKQGGEKLRDASAGAIMASALLELSNYAGNEKEVTYYKNAEQIVQSLSQAPYRSKVGENANFLLQHSVGNMPQGGEIDVPLTYADYYYLEAMKRLFEYR